MGQIRMVFRVACWTAVLLLLAACNGEPAPVRRVRAFHEAVNEIERIEAEGGVIDAPEGFRALHAIYAEYTTTPQAPMTSTTLAMAAGMVRFSNMTYELVSESDGCAIVAVSGEAVIEENTSSFQGEYVVLQQAARWVIDLNATACPEGE
ncbi:MAG: hypothetical protein JXD18_08255 [Anaerolineae bacterium]|nr:hypothetical protein [Anaerolineae bacterium]